MSTISKKFAALAVGASMLMPTLALADTTSSIQALLDQIKALQAQIASIQTQRQALAQQEATVAQQQAQAFASLTSELQQGSTGDQVSALQAMLAMDPSIYPEKQVSGFFGRLTREAVRRFQRKHGISQTGYVGPLTMKRLNELYGRHATSSGYGYGGGNHGYHDQDDDNNVGPNDRLFWFGKVTVCHKPGKANQTIYVATPAVSAHLKHGDTLGACSGGSNGGGTTDTTAPVISSIVANNVSSSGATINWTTNEAATSKVEYGTSTAYGSATALDTNLVTSHGIGITGLSSNTMYHYRVLSKDSAGNMATSSDQTFTTSTIADTTAPSFSSILASGITLTGANITWVTNEAATSQVEYGTTSAYGSTTTLDAAFVTGHSVALSGLTAGTMYHYRVLSKDASNNAASSGDYTFTTVTPDTTAPVISGITVFPIATTTATVAWTTNEAANGKVYYSTTSPVNLSTASFLNDSSLTTSHSFNLTGLTGSTTYNFVVQSTDASSNTATSSQSSFLTTN